MLCMRAFKQKCKHWSLSSGGASILRFDKRGVISYASKHIPNVKIWQENKQEIVKVFFVQQKTINRIKNGLSYLQATDILELIVCLWLTRTRINRTEAIFRIARIFRFLLLCRGKDHFLLFSLFLIMYLYFSISHVYGIFI